MGGEIDERELRFEDAVKGFGKRMPVSVAAAEPVAADEVDGGDKDEVPSGTAAVAFAAAATIPAAVPESSVTDAEDDADEEARDAEDVGARGGGRADSSSDTMLLHLCESGGADGDR